MGQSERVDWPERSVKWDFAWMLMREHQNVKAINLHTKTEQSKTRDSEVRSAQEPGSITQNLSFSEHAVLASEGVLAVGGRDL